MHRIKGIMFDMDNTLLRSAIDFPEMKREIYAFLAGHRLLDEDCAFQRETSSTLIRQARQTGRLTKELEEETWAIVRKHEVKGMAGAELEPGVRELLNGLVGCYRLTVVTNNSEEAARAALAENGILSFFDLVAGRERMAMLKPSPDGFVYVLESYPDIPASEWISVGDSWIDGKGAQEAGIRFVAYGTDIAKMREAGVEPDGKIDHIGQLLDFLASG
ncbi:HAD family hydrolase [Cohnella massiliensis]|uniref:HAD family hydrolase n=1 Tax=Cohnella massiliensis TaxID=1816691 RepID=UPI0009B98F49|nr:HAD family hydrolase [Cohnella massiliensis]